MKIAIVSDLHANLQAWRAVQADLRRVKADLLICLGDIVGYGPEPAEVLAAVCAQANYCLLGNHDAALCGKLDLESFSESAARSLEWTRGQVGAKGRRYLSLLPLTIAAGGFRCSHGEFSVPARFHYVFEPQDAAPSWEAVGERILFVGHTHQPAIFVLGASRTPRRLPPQDFMLEDGKRYLVNVGSVGQPRDGDCRAVYCLYDLEQASVFWRRPAFNLDAFRTALRRSGAPDINHPFLPESAADGQRPAPGRPGFRPSARPAAVARDVVAVQNIDLLRRSVRRWRRLAVLLAGACVLAGLALGWFWRYRLSHPAQIRGAWQALAPVLAGARGVNLLGLPLAASPAGAPIAGWTVSLADSRRQSAAVTLPAAGAPVFQLESGTADGEMQLTSAPVAVVPGMKLCVEGLFRKGPDFVGHLVLSVRLAAGSAGGFARLIVKEPNLPRRGGWLALKHTFAVPVKADRLEILIGGKFLGRAEVKDLSLVRAGS